MKSFFSVLLTTSVALTTSLWVSADDVAKKPSRTLFAGGPGSFPHLESCEMTFNAGWKDVVNAGQIKVNVVASGDSIRVLAHGGNVGAARAILPVEGEFLTVVNPATLEPRAMEQTEKRQGKVLLSSVQFGEGKVSVSKSLNPGEGEETLEYAAEYVTKRAFDLVSAALFLRSQPLDKVGETYSLVIVPQSSPQPFTVTVVGKEKYEYNGEMIDAIKLSVTPDEELTWSTAKPENGAEKPAAAEPTESEKREDEMKEKFKGALGAINGWVSDDERRLPLEASVEVKPIGAVSVKLVEFK